MSRHLGWFLLILMPLTIGCAYSLLAPLECSLVYRPADNPANDPADVWFSAADGTRLHGRFYDHPDRCAVILYCHGNAGSVETWAQSAQEMAERYGAGVFVFDYRGYGKSQGMPSEQGLYQDARAARRWLASKTGIAEHDVILLGRSLGGGVAVELAADGAGGLILQSTFASLTDVAAYHIPWLLPALTMTQRFNSLEKIKRYNGPLLQCHGDNDKLIPIYQARSLFQAAPGPKQFMIIRTAGHNDPPGEEFERMMEEFLQAAHKKRRGTNQ